MCVCTCLNACECGSTRVAVLVYDYVHINMLNESVCVASGERASVCVALAFFITHIETH